jgi:hypothetical protein
MTLARLFKAGIGIAQLLPASRQRRDEEFVGICAFSFGRYATEDFYFASHPALKGRAKTTSTLRVDCRSDF